MALSVFFSTSPCWESLQLWQSCLSQVLNKVILDSMRDLVFFIFSINKLPGPWELRSSSAGKWSGAHLTAVHLFSLLNSLSPASLVEEVEVCKAICVVSVWNNNSGMRSTSCLCFLILCIDFFVTISNEWKQHFLFLVFGGWLQTLKSNLSATSNFHRHIWFA